MHLFKAPYIPYIECKYILSYPNIKKLHTFIVLHKRRLHSIQNKSLNMT